MNKQRILVVDDDTAIRTLLKDSFKILRPNYEVVVAVDGLTALEYLRHHHVDLVMTDYQMPGLNGLDLIHQIDQTWAEVQIILMTGYCSVELATKLESLTLAGYLSKPFDPTQTLAMVDEVLEYIRYEL